MNPILGRYFSGFIFTFTVVMGLSIFLGFGLTAKFNRSKVPDWADTAVFIIVFAWIGARVGFIWANWQYYQEKPTQIYRLWQGGHSYHGAMIAGLLALGVWSLIRKRPFANYAALFVPALILINAGGWLACHYEGCAYGTEAFIGLFSADLPDHLGVFAVRYRTQQIGFLITTLLLLFILKWQKKFNDWELLGIGLFGLSLIHLLLNHFRGDIELVTLNNILDLGFIFLGIGCLGYGRLNTKHKKQENSTHS